MWEVFISGKQLHPTKRNVFSFKTAKDSVRLLPALNIPWSLLKEAAKVIKETAGY